MSFRIALNFLGLSSGNSRRFLSYLMFLECFCQELIHLGYKDAMAQEQGIRAFLEV
jgi:hypothetical protein